MLVVTICRSKYTMRSDITRLVKIYLIYLIMQSLVRLWRISGNGVTSRKVALKRIAKPNFKRVKIFREYLVGIHMVKPVLAMNRPIQVEFAILDLSKVSHVRFLLHYVDEDIS